MRGPTKRQRACKHANTRRVEYARAGAVVCGDCYVRFVPKHEFDAARSELLLVRAERDAAESMHRLAEERLADSGREVGIIEDKLAREKRERALEAAERERDQAQIRWLRQLLHGVVEEDLEALPFRMAALERVRDDQAVRRVEARPMRAGSVQL